MPDLTPMEEESRREIKRMYGEKPKLAGKPPVIDDYPPTPPTPQVAPTLVTLPGHTWRFEFDEATDAEIKRMQRGFAKALRIAEKDIEGSLPITKFRSLWQRLTRHST